MQKHNVKTFETCAKLCQKIKDEKRREEEKEEKLAKCNLPENILLQQQVKTINK